MTEAVHTIERMVDEAARQIGMDPAAFRMKNFIRKDQFPYKTPTGWEYDSGDYHAALQKALDTIGYDDLRKEQAEKRARGELMGIGISSFTEIVGAGPSHDFDIIGIKMFDSAEIRVHPTGTAILRLGVQSQGQGHETTFAQIVAEELGIPMSKVKVEEGDTDTAPYGLGTYASRSTPTAGAATAIAARKIREKTRLLAAHLLECSPDDLEWTPGKFSVKGSPDRVKTIEEIAFAAYTNHPQGMEAGLEAIDYYDPPNLTFPFGTYICVVDIDKGTGQVKIRRFVAIDDCGNIINPMIVDGQIHGGLTMGLAPSLYEEITYDENGNNLAGTFMDYLLPTAMETPAWETGKTITPSPHHPLGAKGVGESATVGAPPAIANAVVDALAHLGVTNIDIPITPQKVWRILTRRAWCSAVPGRSLLRRQAELETAGAVFATATVVAVHRPTSAKPGSRGIIHPDGTIEGWVGGSCAQPVVVREALRSLQDGQPRLLRLSKDAPAEGRRGDGIVELVMTCHSGGTLEIYVEPHLPAPALWVAGTTPIATALAALASATGWRVTVFDPVADPDAFPGSERVLREAGLRIIDPDTSPYVIVATQGIWDEEAVQRALQRDRVSYVGLIASPTRAAVVRAWLRDEGHGRGARRGPPGAGGPGHRGRDGRGGRHLDPRRAGPGAAGPRPVRGHARPGNPCRARGCRGRVGARSRRDRPGGSGLRDDRGSGERPPPRRARGCHLRLLPHGLPDGLHPGAGRISRCRHSRRRLINPSGDPDAVPGHRPDRSAA